MKSLLNILVLLMVLVSCSDKGSDELNPNYLTGGFIVNDTVSRQFDLWACFCNLKDGNLQVTATSGIGFVGEKLIIRMDGGDTTFTFRAWSDIERVPDFTCNEHQITLSKSDLALGDSLMGEVRVKGNFIENPQNGRFEVSGYFKCKLRDSTYNLQSYQRDLREQYDSLRLMKLKKVASCNPDSVIQLELSYDNFYLIENEVGKFKKLEGLSLVGFPEVNASLISNFKNLKYLFIEGDQLTEVPASVGQLDGLEHLILRGPIRKLPDNIYNLSNLKELDIAATDVSKVSLRIKDLKNLEILDIGFTRIRQIPKEIFELPKLAELTLPDTVTLFKIKDLNLKSLRNFNAPYELLLYNKSDIKKLKDLQFLTPTFIYNTHEESEARYHRETRWLEESLPKVIVGGTIYVNEKYEERI